MTGPRPTQTPRPGTRDRTNPLTGRVVRDLPDIDGVDLECERRRDLVAAIAACDAEIANLQQMVTEAPRDTWSHDALPREQAKRARLAKALAAWRAEWDV